MAVLSMMMSNSKANILILDISMPKKDGIAVIKSLLKGYPCKVIVLSSYDDLKIIQEVMKLG
jgi:DNA-binding NarL/FixJ family response regulator